MVISDAVGDFFTGCTVYGMPKIHANSDDFPWKKTTKIHHNSGVSALYANYDGLLWLFPRTVVRIRMNSRNSLHNAPCKEVPRQKKHRIADWHRAIQAFVSQRCRDLQKLLLWLSWNSSYRILSLQGSQKFCRALVRSPTPSCFTTLQWLCIVIQYSNHSKSGMKNVVTRVVSSLQIVNSLRVLFLVCRGHLGEIFSWNRAWKSPRKMPWNFLWNFAVPLPQA